MRSYVLNRRSLLAATGLAAFSAVAPLLLLSPLERAVASTTGVTACADSRPYTASSAWNTPIGAHPSIDPATPTWQTALARTKQTVTSDVDQYTIGLYCITADTPRTSIHLSGYYSDYRTGTRVGHGYAPTITDVPLPTDITPTAGTDAQIVIWDQSTGTEYGFWQFAWTNGRATATNGYVTHTTASDPAATGRFADGLAGRGAGTTYLAGLVRPEELATGTINHALAFGYPFPSPGHVYPASKSDGKGRTGTDLPEGTRLQLDPTLTTTDLRTLGVTDSAIPIAKALQTYGIYVIDNSGSPKIYLQDRTSAAWPATINRTILGTIGWTHFRAITPASGPSPTTTTSPPPPPPPSTTSVPATRRSATMTFEDLRVTGQFGATYAAGPVALQTSSPLSGVASARFPRASAASYLEQRFAPSSEQWVDLTLRVRSFGTNDTRVVQSLSGTGWEAVTSGSLWLRPNGTLLLRNYNTTVGADGPHLSANTTYRIRLYQRLNSNGTIRLAAYVTKPGQAFGSAFSSRDSLTTEDGAVAVVRVGSMASNHTLDASVDNIVISTRPRA